MTAKIPCTQVAADGSCSRLGSGSTFEYDEKGNITLEKYSGGSTAYDYDENGKVTSKSTCYGSAGQCWGYEYKYEAGSNKTTEFGCSTRKAGEPCDYSSATEITYDSDGNVLSRYTCSSWDASGCTAYRWGQEYTYDEDGNQTSYRQCDSWNGTTCSKWGDPSYSLK